MSHVRRLPNGRFEARYRAPDGRERSRRFATRRDAQTFLANILIERQLGAWRDPRGARMPLAEWVGQWRATVVDLRASSLARDDSYLRNHVLPRFGPARLGAITPFEVRRWVSDLTARRLAPATVHKAHQTLSKVMQAAVDANLIGQSPCQKTPLPRIEREEMRFLTAAQIAHLAEEISPHYRALVIFDAYCGLRLSELAGLRRRHVDLAGATVRVVENAVEVRGEIVWGAPKTRAGRRTVPMPTGVRAALEEHLANYVEAEADALVFAGAGGGVLRAGQWRARHWHPAVRAGELEPLRPHDLRHTAVALWIAAGANPKQIATWAGHTSVSVVLDRYGHLFDGHEAVVLNRLDAFMASAPVSAGDDASRGFSRVFRGAHLPGDTGGEQAHVADLHRKRWARRDSNPRHLPCKGSALTS
jgi:integrase